MRVRLPFAIAAVAFVVLCFLESGPEQALGALVVVGFVWGFCEADK